MEFWKMNGAGNDFINIQKLKLCYSSAMKLKQHF